MESHRPLGSPIRLTERGGTFDAGERLKQLTCAEVFTQMR